jgi:hypothetical protein
MFQNEAMKKAGELVLAAPERKRILRELLAAPETWTVTDRHVYREMIQAEWMHVMGSVDDDLAKAAEINAFHTLVLEGVREGGARELAQKARKLTFFEKTEGQWERDRRRTFREAVTALDGAKAVTTGLLTACIVCNGPLPMRKGFFLHRRRADRAYCSDACRQAAYRKRREGAGRRSGLAAATGR